MTPHKSRIIPHIVRPQHVPRAILPDGAIVNERFRIIRLIAEGGMGAIYEASDSHLGRIVALKQIIHGDPGDFENEAKLLASLGHRYLPFVSDYFVADTGHFLAMEYISSEDLHDALAVRDAPFPFATVLTWAEQLLQVLEYLHTRQPPVVHRDIKPKNLKLDADGSIKLLDFGLAKGVSWVESANAESMFGYTAQYAPPEQIGKTGTDARSDLYALGATLYHLLANAGPPEALRRVHAIARGQQDPLEQLHIANPSVPAWFGEIIRDLLVLEPSERPASAAVVARRLSRAQVDERQERESSERATAAPPAPETSAGARQPRELIRVMDDFNAALQVDTYRAALGRQLITNLRTQTRQIGNQLAEPFTIAVIGDFNRGKSTLVNALLGQVVATMNVTTETLTINRIVHGPRHAVTAQLTNGTRVRLQPEDLTAERLEPLLKQMPHPVEHLLIEAPIEWLRGIMLVDMPGSGDVNWRFDRAIQAYLPRADAIIHVVSASSPLSASEKAFLRSAISPQEFRKIVVVINRLDEARSERDVQRLQADLEARVGAVLPDAAVFGISARNELRRQVAATNGEKSTPGYTGAFAEFRGHLEESILLQRDVIQLDRAAVRFGALLQSLGETAHQLRRAMERDQSQLDEAISQCDDENSALHGRIATQRKEMRASILALRDQTAGWMHGFLQRVESGLLAELGSYSLEQIQRHFPFFFGELLSDALNSCLESHQPLIAAKVEASSEAIRNDCAATILPSQTAALDDVGRAAAVLTFNQAAWNQLDTFHLIAVDVQTAIFGFVGNALVNGAMAVIDRQVTAPNQVVAYQRALRKAFPELRTAVQQAVDALYEEIVDRIDRELGQRYQEDIAVSLAMMRQAQQLHGEGTQRVRQAHDTCAELHDLIGEVSAELTAFRSGLWSRPLPLLELA